VGCGVGVIAWAWAWAWHIRSRHVRACWAGWRNQGRVLVREAASWRYGGAAAAGVFKRSGPIYQHGC
jgi:hypothetical protein